MKSVFQAKMLHLCLFEQGTRAQQPGAGDGARGLWFHVERLGRAGVRFSGIEADGALVGVMGLQPVKKVTLIPTSVVLANAAWLYGIGASSICR
jgi:hypothetical protein